MKMRLWALPVLLAAIAVATGPAAAQYDSDGDLVWTWDGSYLPPVRSGVAAFPSQRQANDALDRARYGDPVMTVDFAALAPGKPEPAEIHLFACKPGGYDAYRHRVDRDASFIHCMTFFLDGGQRRLYRRPVNFLKLDRERWQILLPVRQRDPGAVAIDPNYFPPPPSR